MNKLLILAIVIFVGCEVPDSTATHTQKINDRLINTYTIDGCEYIGEIGGDGRNDILTHKGNCKNPIHGTQNH